MKYNITSKALAADCTLRKDVYATERTVELQDVLGGEHDFYCFDDLLYDDGWHFVGGPEKFEKTIISGMCGTYQIDIRYMPGSVFREKYADRNVRIEEEDHILHQRHIMAGLSHIVFDEMLNLFFLKHFFGRTSNTVIWNNPNPDTRRGFDVRQFPQGWEWWLRTITGMDVVSPGDIKGPVLFRRVMTGWVTPNRFWRCEDLDMKDFRALVLNNLGLGDLPPPEGIIFVDRPYRDKHSRRAILNMDEVKGMLELIPNSEMVAMEKLSFREQVKKAASARVFIAAHGAAMTHVFFMQSGAAGIEIMPYNWAYDLYEELAKSVGVSYKSFYVSKDESRFSAEILKDILTRKELEVDPHVIIEEILKKNIRSDNKEFPVGLTRSDMKPFFRDQPLYVDTERLRAAIKEHI